jgi:integrase
MDEELIASNPALRQARNIAKPTPKEDEDRDVVVFDEDEVRRILHGAIERWPNMYPKILILVRTGMREGETLTLQRDGVDFHRQRITVRRTWGSRNTRKDLQCIGLPKGGKRREVDMSPQLAEALTSYMAQADTGPWLFKGAQPRLPMHPTGFLYMWKRVLAHAGVPCRKPHALRHFYASLLIQHGEDIVYIRDQLGHSSTKITLDIYGHLMRRTKESRAAVLGDADWRNPYATMQLRIVE